MPASETFVIAGGGLAGAKAAEALREQGFSGRIVLAAEEDIRPYERPPLSKDYLQGKAERETIFVHSADWYDASRVELLPGTAVTGIDRGRREVTLSDGGRLAYGKLLLATGSAPRRLPLPGADADGVLYLRRVGDSDRIRDTFRAASRIGADAVIIGIGAAPQTWLAEAAGLDVRDGVVTDASLRTSDPDIYAAGDIASAFHPLLGTHIRVEHWANSLHQPETAAAAMLGRDAAYDRVPYFYTDQYDLGNDHLIFSKGHASPLLYAMFKAAGAITGEELVTGFRRFGSRLQGHPTPALPWVDVATGSLGQGLPHAVGIALAGRRLDKLPYQVWVLCGDSEMAEGSMWEALDKAAYYRLGHLTAIVDVNRLGQRGPTELEWDMAAYQRRAEAFGCAAVVVDGHDVAQIDQALAAARDAERPTVILARTVKGKGFAEIEDKNGWHGRPQPADMAQRAVAGLDRERNLHVTMARPGHHAAPRRPEAAAVTLPRYQVAGKVATRKAYGDALVANCSRTEGMEAHDGY